MTTNTKTFQRRYRALFFAGFLLASAVLPRPAAGQPEPSPWQLVQLPEAAAGAALYGVCFPDDTRGFIVGEKGLCLTTTDGGRNWTVRHTGTDATLRHVHFADSQRGWACGDGDPAAPLATGHSVMGRPQKAGVLLATGDGGITWERRWIPTNFEITSVRSMAGDRIAVTTSGGENHLDGDILTSADGGREWSSRRVFRGVFDLLPLDASRLLAVGSPVSTGVINPPRDPLYQQRKSRVLLSVNQGASWKPVAGNDGQSCLRAVTRSETGVLLAVGDRATLLVSTNNGLNWTDRGIQAPRNFKAIACGRGEPQTAVIAGNYGCLIFVQDRAMNCVTTAPPADVDFSAVAATGEGFWTVGAKGTAAHATLDALRHARPAVLRPLPQPRHPLADKQPTATQLARARVGDSVTMHTRMASPVMSADCVVRKTVVETTDRNYVLEIEVLEGKAPPNAPQKQRRTEWYVSFSNPAATPECRTNSTMQGNMPTWQARQTNEIRRAAGEEWTAAVIETVVGASTNGPPAMQIKKWVALDERLPLDGTLRLEISQQLPVPGRSPMVLQQLEELIAYRRGPEVTPGTTQPAKQPASP